METLLIILVLAAAAVAVIVMVRRGKPARPYEQRTEQDTAWNDPMEGRTPPGAVEPIPPEPADPIDPADRPGAPRP